MADRWQQGETRRASFWLATNADAPATGLAPTVTALRVSDGVALAAPAVTEVGSGFYKFSFTAPSDDSFVFLVDGGATLDAAHRYVPMEIPVGGYLANIDAAISTRAPATDTATLLGRLTAARAALLDSLALLDVAVSTRAEDADTNTLLARLTAGRALLLDQLVLLDVAISTRATPADVQLTINPSPNGEVS